MTVLTNSDLLAISRLLDQKVGRRLDRLEEKVEQLDKRLTSVEEKVDRLDKRLTSVEEKMEQLDKRLTSVEEKVGQLDKRLTSVEEKMVQHGKSMRTLNHKIRHMEILTENDIVPRIKNIELCYAGTYERYSLYVEKIDGLCTDVDLLKKVVQEHSEKL